jgi:hypothetical protein
MAELTTEERNALPDSAFAFPAEREEPLVSASHVRVALARFNQIRGVTNKERDEAWRRILAAARAYRVDVHESSWQELFSNNGRRVPND